MIKILQNAIDRLSTLPGIGERSAQRLALFLLKQPRENVELLGNALIDLRNKVKYCKVCNMISEDDVCPICADRRRNRSMICVVESIRDVMRIEETGEFHGTYHVLGGVISPMDGVGPDDLAIDSLVERASSDEVAEVILAISKGMEGETTIFYINKLLSAKGIKVSMIAKGVGFGDDLEYTDTLTLGMSIRNRVPVD